MVVSRQLDMVTVQVVNNRLREIQQVMTTTLFRTGYSVILREGHDGSAGLTDGQGNFLASPLGGAGGRFEYAVKLILKKLPPEEIRDGDIFIFNDPYDLGSGHLPDMGQAMPVFYKGELIAWSASISHKPDIGGLVPGSSGAGSRSLFHEGLILPPVKLYDQGKLDNGVMDIIARNSRAPYLIVGDIRGQAGCLRQGAQMVRKLCDDYGADVIAATCAELLNASERQIRARLAALPDREIEVERYLDHDGVDLTKPVRIHLRLKKTGDRMCFDFTGTGPQVMGPINGGPGAVLRECCLALVSFFDPTIEVNQGISRVVDVIVPEGTILNPIFPAPRATHVVTNILVRACAINALGQVYTESGSADDGPAAGAIGFGHQLTVTGGAFVQYEILNTGSGATPWGDGVSIVHPGSHGGGIAPIEILETQFPVQVTEFSLLRDSGGAGKARGGLGIVRQYRLLANSTFTPRLEGFKNGAEGINGGKSPIPSRIVVNPGTPQARELPSLCSVDLQPGDVVRFELSGGGGYGNPLERDRDAVVADLEDGFISAKVAREEYGLEVDLAETVKPRL